MSRLRRRVAGVLPVVVLAGLAGCGSGAATGEGGGEPGDPWISTSSSPGDAVAGADDPTDEPTDDPSEEPSEEPTEEPSEEPTESGSLPEFDDSTEGTPGAWGRLTDARTGASFGFPEAVEPETLETYPGRDGTEFMEWVYAHDQEEAVVQVHLIAPVKAQPVFIPARALVRRVVTQLRKTGGSRFELGPARTTRRAGVLESRATLTWHSDGVRFFGHIGVFVSRGMAVLVLGLVSDDDSSVSGASQVKRLYDLVAEGIEVPATTPNLSPTEGA